MNMLAKTRSDVPPIQRATYDDIIALPAHVVGQIVGGQLYAHPRPAPRHGRAASRLSAFLMSRFEFGEDGPGGWTFQVEPELHLGDDVMVPDIGGWRLETLPELPSTAYFAMRPDWVCEVLSPSTSRLDRIDKLPRYATAGVSHCWLVDPIERTLEVYELTGSRFALAATFKDIDSVVAPPFAACPFALDLLW
jgi:Uma2 family endonuclease